MLTPPSQNDFPKPAFVYTPADLSQKPSPNNSVLLDDFFPAASPLNFLSSPAATGPTWLTFMDSMLKGSQAPDAHVQALDDAAANTCFNFDCALLQLQEAAGQSHPAMDEPTVEDWLVNALPSFDTALLNVHLPTVEPRALVVPPVPPKPQQQHEDAPMSASSSSEQLSRHVAKRLAVYSDDDVDNGSDEMYDPKMDGEHMRVKRSTRLLTKPSVRFAARDSDDDEEDAVSLSSKQTSARRKLEDSRWTQEELAMSTTEFHKCVLLSL